MMIDRRQRVARFRPQELELEKIEKGHMTDDL